jgi:rhodanese-related sulfurtransferase
MLSEISPRELAARLAAREPTFLLDVREPWEHAFVALADSTLLPLGELPARHGDLHVPPGALVVAYCHHGVRSLSAASFLVGQGWPAVSSLAGGIDAWAIDVEPTLPRY